jgi:hypothetical protein
VAERLLRSPPGPAPDPGALRVALEEVERRRSRLQHAVTGLAMDDGTSAALSLALAFPDIARRGGFDAHLGPATLTAGRRPRRLGTAA